MPWRELGTKRRCPSTAHFGSNQTALCTFLTNDKMLSNFAVKRCECFILATHMILALFLTGSMMLLRLDHGTRGITQCAHRWCWAVFGSDFPPFVPRLQSLVAHDHAFGPLPDATSGVHGPWDVPSNSHSRHWCDGEAAVRSRSKRTEVRLGKLCPCARNPVELGQGTTGLL